MTNFEIFTWFLTAVTIYGTLLNSRQKKMGFLVWGTCNVAWMLIDANRGIWAQAALYAVFISFNVYGWITWSKKEKVSDSDLSMPLILTEKKEAA
jgi:hypothetical protein